MSKPLRILYASGPGNVIGTYNYLIKGQNDPSEVSVTFSSQFFEVCRALCAEGYVISSCSKKDFVDDGQFLIEHRPIPWSNASGILYHLGQVWYAFHLIASAISYKANFAVIDSGTTHWFILSLLPGRYARFSTPIVRFYD